MTSTRDDAKSMIQMGRLLAVVGIFVVVVGLPLYPLPPNREEDFSWAVRRNDGWLIDLWVVPGASRTEVKGVHDGAVRLRVASPPAGGQANRAIETFLSERLGCRVVIVRGAASRRKQVHVDCADLAAIARSLEIGLH